MVIQPKARAGFILSDTAVLDDDGIIRTFGGKVVAGTGRFPFAVGVTGKLHPLALAEAIDDAGARNYKQLQKRLPDILRSAIAAAEHGHAMAVLKGAAWDERRARPVGFILSSDSTLLPAADPFTVYETAYNFTLADGAASLADMLGRDADPTRPDQFDPEQDGLKLVMAQRSAGAASLLPHLHGLRHTIGGEVLLTEISKSGVKTWTLHDFGDQLGARPNAAETVQLAL